MTDKTLDDIEPVDPLILALAPGEWLSGTYLSKILGITRSAVSARIARLREIGVDIYAVSGKGYRLAHPVDPLDSAVVDQQLSKSAAETLDCLIVRQIVDSTNTLVGGYRDGMTRAALAECQTAGRGRGGRPWVSPYASNLYLSIGYELVAPRAPIATVSLAAGVAVAEALSALGIADIGLKWPNDLWIGRDKIGGILTEARAEAGGGAHIVVGLGLNIAMPKNQATTIDQPWTRLIDHWPEARSRSVVAGRCLDAIINALVEFEHDGFSPFVARWTRFDRVIGREIDLVDDTRRRTGTARGIGEDGRLIVTIDGHDEAIYSGDISLRLASSRAVV